ncbi:hypothetical protein B0T16DRAFT_188372 [Cercophora newfieldiana]|uniref:C2H2-type domain-containing protein n=1 Tax=Cercophora newfieldiana TaxID=92897 RepID=A0AA40CNQ3_9PEZI|nr:hypothetical protein B0T16DRAFT_188372 [Cercophora newfieldiana]
MIRPKNHVGRFNHANHGRIQKGKPQSRRPRQSPPKSEHQFACPFAKHNPRLHRDCLKFRFSNVSYLRQHLWRKHLCIQCPKCGLKFPDSNPEKNRDEHVAERGCTAQEFPPNTGMITEDQKAEIDRHGEASIRGTPAEKQWYKIWEILFENQPHPASPYEVSFAEQFRRVIRSYTNGGEMRRLIERFDIGSHCLLDEFSALLLEGLGQHASSQREQDNPDQNARNFPQGQLTGELHTYPVDGGFNFGLQQVNPSLLLGSYSGDFAATQPSTSPYLQQPWHNSGLLEGPSLEDKQSSLFW